MNELKNIYGWKLIRDSSSIKVWVRGKQMAVLEYVKDVGFWLLTIVNDRERELFAKNLFLPKPWEIEDEIMIYNSIWKYLKRKR